MSGSRATDGRAGDTTVVGLGLTQIQARGWEGVRAERTGRTIVRGEGGIVWVIQDRHWYIKYL